MDYTKSIGNVNELKCITAFIELGYDVCIPYGDSSKYDFIVDVDNKFWKIQCKSSRYCRRNGVEDQSAFNIDTICQTTNTKTTVRKQYSKEDVDYFCTCFNDKVYIIPVEECSTNKTLRFSRPKSNISNYNAAEDYELNKILSPNLKYLESKESYLNRLVINEGCSKTFCKSCGKETSGSEYCSECIKIINRKVERPDRELFKSEIRNSTFRELATKYKVSDKTITKWAKYYKLPSRKTDINNISDEDWEKV